METANDVVIQEKGSHHVVQRMIRDHLKLLAVESGEGLACVDSCIEGEKRKDQSPSSTQDEEVSIILKKSPRNMKPRSRFRR